ncbi:uncharacterized protein [Dermacentor albipictus]|uniref:uncharacterized protein isoform X1 n=1 Tax=Dermacentor albipictus TaxID=60249 RepID=UPI0038FD1132
MGCAPSKSRHSARKCALGYALLNVACLILEVMGMMVLATFAHPNRRPYVWLSCGTGCLLRTVNVGFVVVWIVAAAQDRLSLMIFISTAMLGRLVGMLLYAAAYLLYDPFEPTSAAAKIQRGLLHTEEEFSPYAPYFIVATAGVEALFVQPVAAYQQAFHIRSEMEAMSAAPAPVQAAAIAAERGAAHAPAEAEPASAPGAQEEHSGEHSEETAGDHSANSEEANAEKK